MVGCSQWIKDWQPLWNQISSYYNDWLPLCSEILEQIPEKYRSFGKFPLGVSFIIIKFKIYFLGIKYNLWWRIT